jgi:hypothetical protein
LSQTWRDDAAYAAHALQRPIIENCSVIDTVRWDSKRSILLDQYIANSGASRDCPVTAP